LLLSHEGIRPIITRQFNHMIVMTIPPSNPRCATYLSFRAHQLGDKITASWFAAVLWSADHKGKAR